MPKDKSRLQPPKSLQDFVNGDHPMGRLSKMKLEDTVTALKDLSQAGNVHPRDEWETHGPTKTTMQPMGITEIRVHERGSAICFSVNIPLPAAGVFSALGPNHMSAETAGGYFQNNLTELEELENPPEGSRLFYRRESDYGKGQTNWGNFGPFSGSRDYCYVSHLSHGEKPDVFSVSMFSVSDCNKPPPKGVTRGRFVFLFEIHPAGPWACELKATAVCNFGGGKCLDKAEMMRVPYTWLKAFSGFITEPSQLAAMPSFPGLDAAKPLSQQPKQVVLDQIKQRLSTTRQLLDLPFDSTREIKYQGGGFPVTLNTHSLPLAGGTAVQSQWSLEGVSPQQACAALMSPAFLGKNSFMPLTRPPVEKAYIAPVRLFGDHYFQVVLQRQRPEGAEEDGTGQDSAAGGTATVQSLMVQCLVSLPGQGIQLLSMPLCEEALKALIAIGPEQSGHGKHSCFTSLERLLERLQRKACTTTKESLVGSYSVIELLTTDSGITNVRHVVAPDQPVRNNEAQKVEISSAYVEQITGTMSALKATGYCLDRISIDQVFGNISRAWSAVFPVCSCQDRQSVESQKSAVW